MFASNLTKDKLNISPICFPTLENPSLPFKLMKESLETLFKVSCPSCELLKSLPCKCHNFIKTFQNFFVNLIFPNETSIKTFNLCLETLGKNVKKNVCGKILKKKDIGFKCLDCEMDTTCIICQECFEKSNHKGHRTIQQASCSGCCDCGDREAWKSEGFCIDHQGFKSEDEMEKVKLLPKDFLNNYYDSFRMLFFFFFLACEIFFLNWGVSKSSKLILFWKMIVILLKKVNKDENLLLNALQFDLLRNGLENDNFKLFHECSNHEAIYLLNNRKKCECSILENIFRF